MRGGCCLQRLVSRLMSVSSRQPNQRRDQTQSNKDDCERRDDCCSSRHGRGKRSKNNLGAKTNGRWRTGIIKSPTTVPKLSEAAATDGPIAYDNRPRRLSKADVRRRKEQED